MKKSSSNLSFRIAVVATAVVTTVLLTLMMYILVRAEELASTAKTTATESGELTSTEETIDDFMITLNRERDYLFTIVNDNRPYAFGGDYDLALQQDIIYVSDCDGYLTPIEKATNAAFTLLRQRLAKEDIIIELYSCYRTEADQQWVYDTYGNLEGWAENNKVMKPGFSEHHTGLLLSFVVLLPDEENPDKLVWTELTADRRAAHPELEAIYESLADFGFIERYPASKEAITGVPAEPYELRFIGSSKYAHAIMDNGLCLEEYIATHEE